MTPLLRADHMFMILMNDEYPLFLVMLDGAYSKDGLDRKKLAFHPTPSLKNKQEPFSLLYHNFS